MTEHVWYAEIRRGMPVLVCSGCRRVWWPDQPTPAKPCRGGHR